MDAEEKDKEEKEPAPPQEAEQAQDTVPEGGGPGGSQAEGGPPEGDGPRETGVPRQIDLREVFGPPPPGAGIERLLGEEEGLEMGGEKKAGGKKSKKKPKKKGRKGRTPPKVRLAGDSDEGQDGEAPAKKGGMSRGRAIAILVILVVAVALLLSALMTVILLHLLSAREPERPGPDPTASVEPAETPAPSESESASSEPAPAPTREMSRTEAVEFIEKLSPEALGLEGDDMDEYVIRPAGKVVMVGDVPCQEVYIYSDQNPTETNDFLGRYLLSQSEPRRLFQVVDEATGAVRELPLEVRSDA